MQWFSDICTEITKYTSQSSVLLPKTPTVKRNLRKKRMVETIPEDSKSELCYAACVFSVSLEHDTCCVGFIIHKAHIFQEFRICPV
jgi:hypothetical protein